MHKKSRQLVMNQRSFFLKIGRGDRTRTCDSLVPNQERYQLRYTSLPESGCKGTKKKSKRAIKGKKNATAQQSLTIQPCDSSYFLLFCCFDIPLFDNTLLDENLIIPCSTKIFFKATTERSTCSLVWVAMRA